MFDAGSEGWREVRLGDVALINPESLGKRTDPDFAFGYIDISQIEQPGVCAGWTPTTFSAAPSRARRPVRDEDIIVSTVRPYLRAFAKVPLSDRPLVASTGFAVVRANDGVDQDFLFQHVMADDFVDHLKPRMTGSNYPAVSADDVSDYQFLLPPLDEQRRIAEVLRSVNEAFSMAADVSAQCLSTRSEIVDRLLHSGLRSGGLEGSASWEEIRLSDVLRIKHGFAFSSEFFRSEDTGTILLTPGNFSISKRLYFGSNTKFYDGPIPEGYVLSNGDLLVVMTDLTQDMAILGNAVRLDASARVLHNQRIGKVDCDTSRIDVNFARLLLNSPGVQSRVRASASGTTVRHTSPGKILEIKAKLPPLDEQREIVDVACALDLTFESGAAVAAPVMRGMGRGSLHEVFASIRTDLLSGRVRVPA